MSFLESTEEARSAGLLLLFPSLRNTIYTKIFATILKTTITKISILILRSFGSKNPRNAFFITSNPKIAANMATINPAIGSALLCPKGWSISAFLAPVLTATKIAKEASISVKELKESESKARLPERIPPNSFIAKRTVLAAIPRIVILTFFFMEIPELNNPILYCALKINKGCFPK
jgi:hypothetical protein